MLSCSHDSSSPTHPNAVSSADTPVKLYLLANELILKTHPTGSTPKQSSDMDIDLRPTAPWVWSAIQTEQCCCNEAWRVCRDQPPDHKHRAVSLGSTSGIQVRLSDLPVLAAAGQLLSPRQPPSSCPAPPPSACALSCRLHVRIQHGSATSHHGLQAGRRTVCGAPAASDEEM